MSVFGVFLVQIFLHLDWIWRITLQKFIRPSPSNFFDCDNHKPMTRLRVALSHLREHKFKHNFQDCLNPICSCSLDIKSTSHFLLHRLMFNPERYKLLSTLNKIDSKLLELTNYLKLCYMATDYLIKKKKHSFLRQLLNVFYLLKYMKSLLFSKISLQSLNPSFIAK